MHTNLTLILEFGVCNGCMDVLIQDRHGIVDCVEKNTSQELELNYSIVLPNQLCIKLSNKNYQTDTTIDLHGNITQNKFVKLKRLWLGKIELEAHSLIQICAYQTDRDTHQRFSTFWDCNGTVTLDFFDKTTTEFLLHLNNKLNIPTTQ